LEVSQLLPLLGWDKVIVLASIASSETGTTITSSVRGGRTGQWSRRASSFVGLARREGSKALRTVKTDGIVFDMLKESRERWSLVGGSHGKGSELVGSLKLRDGHGQKSLGCDGSSKPDTFLGFTRGLFQNEV
jgi:hypothetical protein